MTRRRRSVSPMGWRTLAAGLAMGLVILPAATKGQNRFSPGKESVLYSFAGGSDGAEPVASLIWDAHHKYLYGTTAGGGAPGFGTVFKINTAGKETVVYTFQAGQDGAEPVASLISDDQGNLYGTTAGGGSPGLGVVFKLSRNGKETILYTFAGGNDGAEPTAALIWDAKKENLYGTTLGGGPDGLGTVFKLSKTGKETVLYSFVGGNDGAGPAASLIWDARHEYLYGTTTGGGAPGYGAVFKINTAGKESILYTFQAGQDGAEPVAPLLSDDQGNLYGTTAGGGTPGLGVVFQLTKSGKESVLYTFEGGADGAEPTANLIWDQKQQYLYSTTAGGGTLGLGTVFKLSKKGKETALYSFSNTGGDGQEPKGGLVWDANRNLYGTTAGGGAAGLGAIFKVTP
jgi:uncharacterized repeat protein (TIGR03803 family)